MPPKSDACLGSLNHLPLEIRQQIYEYVFGYDGLSYPIARPVECKYYAKPPPPSPLLITSRLLREEALEVFQTRKAHRADLVWNSFDRKFLPIEFIGSGNSEGDNFTPSTPLSAAQNLDIRIKMTDSDDNRGREDPQPQEPTVTALQIRLQDAFLSSSPQPEKRRSLRLLVEWHVRSSETSAPLLYTPFMRTLSKLKLFEVVDVDVIWPATAYGSDDHMREVVLSPFQTFWHLKLGPGVVTKGETEVRDGVESTKRPTWSLRFRPYAWFHQKDVRAKDEAWTAGK